ncbi:hypothetical protein HanIR_Chr15g0729041 [Helianthus annuus]|nr:hypothetical protein HanIR_Chr15g0729041 [Helianthus annuus]
MVSLGHPSMCDKAKYLLLKMTKGQQGAKPWQPQNHNKTTQRHPTKTIQETNSLKLNHARH